MISKQIKEMLAKEIRSKSEVDEIVSHLVSKHIRTGTLEFNCAVKMLLRQCFSPEEIKRKSIARKIFTSERNLVRKLKKEGVTYRQLVDEVRKERCMALLQQGTTATGELTLQLCYSDSSYVYRAFRRWTGISLAEAKRILAQNPNELVSIFHSEEELGDANLSRTSESMRSKTSLGGKGMRELTIQETDKVGGAVAPVVAVFAGRAAFGAYVGAAAYMGAVATGSSFSWRGFGSSVSVGAIGGLAGVPGVGTFARYALPRASFATTAAWGI